MVVMPCSLSNPKDPEPIAELKGAKARFDNVTEKENMKLTVFEALGIK